jgi:uncharacterized protein (DUF427 family)
MARTRGGANYYSVPRRLRRSANAVWEYLSPYPALAEVAGCVAFYPDRVEAITEELVAAAINS